MKFSIASLVIFASLSIATQPIVPPSSPPAPAPRPIMTAEPPMQGDGKCPINVGSDPDCAAEGAESYKPSKLMLKLIFASSREQYPRRDSMGGGMPPGPDGNGPKIPPARRGGFTSESYARIG